MIKAIANHVSKGESIEAPTSPRHATSISSELRKPFQHPVVSLWHFNMFRPAAACAGSVQTPMTKGLVRFVSRNSRPSSCTLSNPTVQPHQQQLSPRVLRRNFHSTTSQIRPLSTMSPSKEYRLLCLENPLLGKPLSQPRNHLHTGQTPSLGPRTPPKAVLP